MKYKDAMSLQYAQDHPNEPIRIRLTKRGRLHLHFQRYAGLYFICAIFLGLYLLVFASLFIR